ncbi:MAG: hypothetical protein DRP50_06070 [Thermotoga sp.]|nr:MAG: hypothetical protein DRP50_06070 [Thermotoga sp.]
MKIGTKLVLSTFMIAMIVAIVGVVLWQTNEGIRLASVRTEKAVEASKRAKLLSDEIEKLALSEQSAITLAIQTTFYGNAEDIKRLKDSFGKISQEASNHLNEVEAMNIPEIGKDASDLKELHHSVEVAGNTIFTTKEMEVKYNSKLKSANQRMQALASKGIVSEDINAQFEEPDEDMIKDVLKELDGISATIPTGATTLTGEASAALRNLADEVSDSSLSTLELLISNLFKGTNLTGDVISSKFLRMKYYAREMLTKTDEDALNIEVERISSSKKDLELLLETFVGMFNEAKRQFLLMTLNEYIKSVNSLKNNILSLVEITGQKDMVKSEISGIQQMMDALKSGMGEQIQQLGEDKNNINKRISHINEYITNMRKQTDASVNDAMGSINESVVNAKLILIIAIIIAAIAAVVIGFLLKSSMMRILIKLKSVALNMGRGNLAVEVEKTDRKDEFGILQNVFVDTLSQLRKMVRGMAETSEGVADASSNLSSSVEESTAAVEEVSASMNDISSQITKSASAANDVVNNIETVTSTMDETAQRIEEMLKNVKSAIEISEENRDVIMNALNVMAETKEVMNTSTVVVKQLEESSGSIGNYVEMISSIAEQTNLLALNAAIEAARAGEAGKGFAVVAEEIRKLADESTSAADEIAKVLNDIKDKVEDIVSTMEVGSMKIEGISDVSTHAKESLNEINKKLGDINNTILQAAETIHDQVTSMHNTEKSVSDIAETFDSINHSVKEITIALQEQSDNSTQLATMSEQLSNMAENLDQIIGTFKLR